MLTFDEAWRKSTTQECDCCGNASRRTWTMVDRDARPYAVFFAACYDHGHERETWIDVTFGTWGQGADHHDHVTFGCRFGRVAGSEAPAATAVDAARVAPDDPLFGQKLSRAEALSHPRVKEFWEVVDLIVLHDPLVHQHHYGHAPA
ncbi:hypothetical protein [Catellatospora sichuanensis]|uniref:hypothetical protein n=1 Tax=Catellatospora sichuanensis TaxID=1969805 RepID=UPI001181D1DA|nr:hypothetical protein [Catellatospora sichuanensis]